MSVLTEQQLADAITSCKATDCETINGSLTSVGVYVCPIDDGGNGCGSETRADIVDTISVISKARADTVNGLIETPYMIISQNGYPT